MNSKPTRAELVDLVERYRLALHDIRRLADDFHRLDQARKEAHGPRLESGFLQGVDEAAIKATKHLVELDPGFATAFLAEAVTARGKAVAEWGPRRAVAGPAATSRHRAKPLA